MTTRFVWTTLGVALAAVAAACGSDSTAPKQETFTAALTAGQEVQNSAVTSTATGTATVVVVDENTITYKVDVQNLNDIILSHFHAGTPDISGPVLFDFNPGSHPGAFNGTLVTGTVTRSSTFAGAFSFDSLLVRLRGGALYVNVHTNLFKGGEIRGNLLKAP